MVNTMSYEEIDGGLENYVVLRMSMKDYQILLTCTGMALSCVAGRQRRSILEMLDRINEGNPHYENYMDKRAR